MNWIPVAVALSLGLSVISIAVSIVALRANHRQLNQVRSTCRRLESALAVANSAAIGMGNRLIAMEKRIAQRANQPGGSADEAMPYTEANQMFRKGLSVEEVARECGLSRAEASLLQAMQEHQR